VQSLLEQILVHDEAMGHACDVCAELDCLLSFAEASRAYNYVRPRMSEENIIDIKRGRHPLQELVVDTFVPNDAFVVGGAGTGSEALEHIAENESDENRREQNSIIVCTGANACGKSVYLKQVALIQYMAQVRRLILNCIIVHNCPCDADRMFCSRRGSDTRCRGQDFHSYTNSRIRFKGMPQFPDA